MRNRTVVPLIAALSIALETACSSTAPSGPAVWGSDQALLTVEGGSATLQILDSGGCYGSFGKIDQSIPTGSFDLSGTFTQLMGVFPGSVEYAAQFSGTVTGNRMLLTVTVPALERALGPFNLEYGVGEEWQICLYP